MRRGLVPIEVVALLLAAFMLVTGCGGGDTTTVIQQGPPTTTTPTSGTTTTVSCPADTTWDQASTRIGQTISVTGPVAGASFRSDVSGEPTFINLGHDYPNPNRLTVVVWIENRPRFSVPPESAYIGQNVVVTGKVTQYQGVPQIEVSSPDQIQTCPTTAPMAKTTPTPEPRYEGFISCSLYTKDADDFCYGGDQPGANFRALDSDQVPYEMCVRSPSGEQTCTPGRTGVAGQLSKIPIDANQLGLFHVQWKVADSRVYQTRFTLAVEGGE